MASEHRLQENVNTLVPLYNLLRIFQDTQLKKGIFSSLLKEVFCEDLTEQVKDYLCTYSRNLHSRYIRVYF